jgi:alpha-galactosidase
VKRGANKMMKLNTIIPMCLAVLVCADAKSFPSLAPTPPMGWNSWNWFGKNDINEGIVREVIDAMATNGLRDAGYTYICCVLPAS